MILLSNIGRLAIGMSFLILVACTQSDGDQEFRQNADFVDPFICTSDDHGQTDPAAAVPFGMVKPCPDTWPIAHSGYDYSANEIIGFSHTRFSGVGCRGVGGNIRLLPFLGNDSVPYKIAYVKESEKASPGFYSVKLSNGIKAELTATRQVAFHHYTFPESDQATIAIDLTSSFVSHISEEHKINEEGIISGMLSSVNICKKGKYTFYYALWLDKEVVFEESGSTILCRFTTDKQEVVKAYCALSSVSAENAVKTLKEKRNMSFEEVRTASSEKWNDLLKAVDVETANDTLKRLFYTHLYHAVQSPFMIQDENGQYRGSDGKIYQANGSPYFHGWSIWDTFRTKLPLVSFLFPEIYSQMMGSLGELYQQGKVPWATETEPFITVRTEHSLVVLLEAHRKGLLIFSLDEIYPLLKEEAKTLPFKSPDNVLESSFDLWALSEIAGDLGYVEDQRFYLKKAFEYRKLWEEKFLFMDEHADIMHGDGLYEGTLWQYRWFVPFDIAGIQELMGGKQVFEDQLDYFFENELFNIGNQPDIQVPYLYAYTNSPWKTQRLVHQLLTQPTNNWYGTHKKWKTPEYRKVFSDSPRGYISEMDDDAGTMSSWFVWSAMGLYPVFPGSTQLVINTPLFEKITINLGGNRLIINAPGVSSENKYIQETYFNGEKLNSSFIDFNTIKNGGVIDIKTGNIPNKNWGIE